MKNAIVASLTRKILTALGAVLVALGVVPNDTVLGAENVDLIAEGVGAIFLVVSTILSFNTHKEPKQ